MFLWVQEVEYLGHIISNEGVKVEPKTIKSIKEWEIPTTLRHLQGFLRLIEYYCKFVKNYGKIATPLTKLLKKDAFFWTLEENKAFEHLKEAMFEALIRDLKKNFIVKCDASKNGIGVILMQEGRLVAFESRPIKGNYL